MGQENQGTSLAPGQGGAMTVAQPIPVIIRVIVQGTKQDDPAAGVAGAKVRATNKYGSLELNGTTDAQGYVRGRISPPLSSISSDATGFVPTHVERNVSASQATLCIPMARVSAPKPVTVDDTNENIRSEGGIGSELPKAPVAVPRGEEKRAFFVLENGAWVPVQMSESEHRKRQIDPVLNKARAAAEAEFPDPDTHPPVFTASYPLLDLSERAGLTASEVEAKEKERLAWQRKAFDENTRRYRESWRQSRVQAEINLLRKARDEEETITAEGTVVGERQVIGSVGHEDFVKAAVDARIAELQRQWAAAATSRGLSPPPTELHPGKATAEQARNADVWSRYGGVTTNVPVRCAPNDGRTVITCSSPTWAHIAAFREDLDAVRARRLTRGVMKHILEKYRDPAEQRALLVAGVQSLGGFTQWDATQRESPGLPRPLGTGPLSNEDLLWQYENLLDKRLNAEGRPPEQPIQVGVTTDGFDFWGTPDVVKRQIDQARAKAELEAIQGGMLGLAAIASLVGRARGLDDEHRLAAVRFWAGVGDIAGAYGMGKIHVGTFRITDESRYHPTITGPIVTRAPAAMSPRDLAALGPQSGFPRQPVYDGAPGAGTSVPLSEPPVTVQAAPPATQLRNVLTVPLVKMHFPGGIPPAEGVRLTQSIRASLKIEGRNVAIAEAELGGSRRLLTGVSGKASPPGTVPSPDSRLFTTKASGAMTRAFDSEVKLLEDIAKDLSEDAKGRISLYTERKPCSSCDSVIQQFRKRFPNIIVEITSGQ